MLCDKRDQLFEDYRHLVERLAAAVLALRDGSHTDDFDVVYGQSEQIRRDCDQARRTLEEHRSEHGC